MNGCVIATYRCNARCQMCKRNQFFLFTLGLCLRVVNKVRRIVIGYTSPRTFSTKEIERNVIYCLNVVKNWEKALIPYTGSSNPFSGKHVIEIGPGPDLGTGIVILALGAKSYTAVDKNELIHKTPPNFYNVLLTHLMELPGYSNAKATVNHLQKGEFNEDFCYIWDPCFSLQRLPLKSFDILVSQAVLEHLANVRRAFEILYHKLNPNAVMVHEVDLGTHTGLIRRLDPLNHLRYSDMVWNLLRFDGSPNRFRVTDYQKILNQLGFGKIKTKRILVLDKEYVEKSKPHLSEKFRKYPDEDIGTKSFYLLATKK